MKDPRVIPIRTDEVDTQNTQMQGLYFVKLELRANIIELFSLHLWALSSCRE